MKKDKAQKDYLEKLRILTSDEAPIKHPFDFSMSVLGEIKRLFPEHK